MAEANNSQWDASPLAPARPQSRRKIRRGTISCWECKRRKIRCAFASPVDTVCNGCQRRGTKCISQDLPDHPEPPHSENLREMGSRISRMEALIERLTARLDGEPRTSGVSENALGASNEMEIDIQATSRSWPTAHHVNTTAPVQIFEQSQPPRHTTDETGLSTICRGSLQLTTFTAVRAETQRRDHVEKYSRISDALREAWPSDHDLQIIVNIPHGASGLLHAIVDKPFSYFSTQTPPSPREILQLPSSGSHPIILAHKLLTLASFLQCIPSSSLQGLSGLSTSPVDIMTRAVDTAVKLVVSDDDLVDSVESVECIMIYSLYENNKGNLRRAWVILRRATALAQVMGLHQGAHAPLPKTACVETRRRINPEHMWRRLNQSDQYLSLVLGLPPACTQTDELTDLATLERCTAAERMERLEAMASGHILRRNTTDLSDLNATQEVDEILRKASECMPPQWWLMPDLAFSSGDEMHVFRETVRITTQFTHYTLLLHLHLPYVLCSSDDQRYDQSKITAATASREILVRYLAIRDSDPTSFYCRGIEFIAFIACTVLSLAHIQAHCRPSVSEHNLHQVRGAVFAYLKHQRLSDRGIMERVLESIDRMVESNGDRIASKIAVIVRPLLAIEANAAHGSIYETRSSLGVKEEDLECNGSLCEDDSLLHIYIPNTGSVDIEHCGHSRSTNHPPATMLRSTSPDVFRADLGSACHGPSAGEQVNGDLAMHSRTCTEPSSVVGVASPADDWALQGVDVALFDNLFNGVAMSGIDSDDDCTHFMGDISVG